MANGDVAAASEGGAVGNAREEAVEAETADISGEQSAEAESTTSHANSAAETFAESADEGAADADPAHARGTSA